MRKIINRKKYDTETAEWLSYFESGNGMSDFHYCYEVLYRKKTGEFFLYGEGGGLTKYAESTRDGMRTFGKNIFPITEEEAKDWVETFAVDKYEEIFGPVEE